MTKEEFEKRDAELLARLEEITRERRQLKNEYMASNRECIEGDRVILTLKDGTTVKGYVAYIHAGNYFGRFKQNGISYHFQPLRKDGEPSTRQFRFSMDDVVSFEIIRPVFDGINEFECEAFDNRF